MSLCPKCVIGGVLQGSSSFAFDEDVDAPAFHLELAFTLDTDSEQSVGERSVSFDGNVTEGTLVDGVIEGRLSGRFDVLSDKELAAPAVLRTFNSRGVLAFLHLAVEDESGRTFFTANVRPLGKSLDPQRALRNVAGTVFLGWDDPARGDGEMSG
jgi:hypothetical protein